MFSAGIDAAYASLLKEVCSKKNVNIKPNVLVHLMHLPDNAHLPTSTVVRYGQKNLFVVTKYICNSIVITF